MTASRPSYPRLVSAALGLVACAAAIAVAQTPIPQSGRAVGVAGNAMPYYEIAPQALELIQKLVTDYYPTVMQGSSPINRITFVVDADGNYVTSAAWTDTAMLRRSAATTTTSVSPVPPAPNGESKREFAEVRAVIGGGGGVWVRAPGTDGRTGVARERSGGAGDFGAVGFPNIARDAVMSIQSASSVTPSALSVVIIRLKNEK